MARVGIEADFRHEVGPGLHRGEGRRAHHAAMHPVLAILRRAQDTSAGEAVRARLAEGLASAEEVLDTVARAGFTATCDQPTADFYAQQLRKYPDAKVILTVRDNGRKWAASWKVLMHFIEVQERPFSLRYPTFIQWIPFMRAWKRMRGCIVRHFAGFIEELDDRLLELGLDKKVLEYPDIVKATPPAQSLTQPEEHELSRRQACVRSWSARGRL